MNKTQQDNAELLLFKQMVESNPALKEYFNTLKNGAKPELKAIIEPAIKPLLEKVRMEGVQIGWKTFAIQAYNNIKEMHSIKEVKAYFKEESKKMDEQFSPKKAEPEPETQTDNV